MGSISINKKVYSSADVRVDWLGRSLVGVQEINWDWNEDINPAMAVGSKKPIGYTQGNFNATGSITLTIDEYNLLTADLKDNESLSDLLPSTISVLMFNNETGESYTDQLKGVKVKGTAVSGITQGSTDVITKQLSLYVGDIVENKR